jgi:hypothetical protein
MPAADPYYLKRTGQWPNREDRRRRRQPDRIEAPARSLHRLVRLSPGDLTLAELARTYRQRLADARAAGAVRAPSDTEIDRIVCRYGADALMRGLDRATAPQLVAAE